MTKVKNYIHFFFTPFSLGIVLQFKQIYTHSLSSGGGGVKRENDKLEHTKIKSQFNFAYLT